MGQFKCFFHLSRVFGDTVYDCGYIHTLYPNTPGQSSVLHCAVYAAEGISVIEINEELNDGVISAGFSGCYMATFTHNSKKYVAHIPQHSKSDSACKMWNDAIQAPQPKLSEITLFKPTDGFEGDPRHMGIWGLITPDGKCYRIEANENTETVKGSGKRTFVKIPDNHPSLTKISPIGNKLILLDEGTESCCIIQ